MSARRLPALKRAKPRNYPLVIATMVMAKRKVRLTPGIRQMLKDRVRR